MLVNCSKNVYINLVVFFERELVYLIFIYGFYRRLLFLGFIKGKKKYLKVAGR